MALEYPVLPTQRYVIVEDDSYSLPRGSRDVAAVWRCKFRICRTRWCEDIRRHVTLSHGYHGKTLHFERNRGLVT